MKTILVPTRFNESSDYAMASAASLARKTGASLVLMHALQHDLTLLNDARTLLGRLAESEEMMGIRVTTLVVEGNLIDHLEDDDPDIIVIGSHEVQGILDFLKTNHAKQVSRRAYCPVITVKEFTDLGNIRRIIYPTDMRGEQGQIVEDIKELQAMNQGHLHLFKAYGNQILKSSDVEKRLAEFAEVNGLVDYSVTARFNMDEASEILNFASEMKADIIAMATHDRLGIERILTGYISAKVIKGSPCAVWTKLIH